MRFLLVILVLFVAAIPTLAQEKHASSVSGTLVNDRYDFTDINNVRMWISNNGSASHNPLTRGSGLEWPRNSGKFLVFQEGLIVGGVVQDENRIGGSTYKYGLQAGCILPSGAADDPASDIHRVYKARKFDAGWWIGLTTDEQSRFIADFVQWPVAYGAPWTDANANSIYDPDTNLWKLGGATDTPLMVGDEVLWFVSNDLDPQRTINLYGSLPMGLEIQTLVWSSGSHPLLQDVMFREYTIINKGSETINNVYLGAWEDPDLGEADDDFVGVDTTLGLTYVYNGQPYDDVYGLPPASGTLWLQTPVSPDPGQTARFGLGARRNYSNLPISAFMYYYNSDPVYADPDLGTAAGSDQMMFNLKGLFYDGLEPLDPINGVPTRMVLAGDPVMGSGWVDGSVHEAKDRRCLSSSGDFTLAPGDTQKVILARVVATGGNHLLAVDELRQSARQLRDLYLNYPMGAPAPSFTSSITYPSATTYQVHVSGGPFMTGTSLVEAVLRSTSGGELQRITLSDDGAHGDGLSGDGVFGGAFAGNTLNHSAELYVLCATGSGTQEWFVDDGIALPGKARVRIAEVASDHLNFDGRANPGEDVRLRLGIDNTTGMTLGPWQMMIRDSMSWISDRAVVRFNEQIPSGGSGGPAYDPVDAGSYITFTIPENGIVGSFIHLPVTLIAENGCVWEDTLSLQIKDFTDEPISGYFKHIQGPAYGTLGFVVADRSLLTDYDYVVTIEGEDHETKTLNIENITLGTTLYRGRPLPDSLAHNSTTADGWRITPGTARDFRYYSQNGQAGPDRPFVVEGQFSEPSRAWFRVYNNCLLIGEDFFGSTLNLYETVPVQLIFDRGNGQKAMAWLRGASPNYSYQGYFNIPLRAYDISDTSNPRQLMVGFVEQQGSPAHDNVWSPTLFQTDREYLFIFNDDYSDIVDTKFQTPYMTSANNLDVLYGIWPMRLSDTLDFMDGDRFTITPTIPVSKRDVYTLIKPRLVEVHSAVSLPVAIALHQNYPNPFGSGMAGGGAVTNIRLDLPVDGHVRLAVYDLLGRRVATVLERTMSAGTHRLRFDAASLQSGMYILSLDAGGTRESRRILVLR